MIIRYLIIFPSVFIILTSCSTSALKNPGAGIGLLPTLRTPVSGIVTQRFSHTHDGIDIAAKPGTPVMSAYRGTVVFSGSLKGYGKTIIISHPNRMRTLYAHLRKRWVKKNKKVKKGQIIGTVGNTGRSTGPHLHFETHHKGSLRDPELFSIL